MYKLHYAPDNASLIIRLALEELGLPYRTALINRAIHQQDSTAYRRLNPQGLIPTLETPEGPIFETGAILLWLADRHGGNLAPPSKNPDRGAFLKWLFFIANTLHADLRALFYPERYVPEEMIGAHHAMTITRLKAHYALLNQAATETPALFTPPSALACYLAPLIRWSVLYPENSPRWLTLTDYPALAALAANLESSPACQRSAAAEGLGPNPFTAPVYACPPEGSAT